MFKRVIIPVVILFSSLAAAQSWRGEVGSGQPKPEDWAWQHRRDGVEAGTRVPLPPTTLDLLEQGANEVCILVHRDGTGTAATHFHVTPYDMKLFERDGWTAIPPQPKKSSFWRRFMEIMGDSGYEHSDRWR